MAMEKMDWLSSPQLTYFTALVYPRRLCFLLLTCGWYVNGAGGTESEQRVYHGRSNDKKYEQYSMKAGPLHSDP